MEKGRDGDMNNKNVYGRDTYIHTQLNIDHSPLGLSGPMKQTTEMNLTG